MVLKKAAGILIIILGLIPHLLVSQTFDKILVGKEYDNLSFEQFSERIESSHGIKILINPDSLSNYTIRVIGNGMNLMEVIDHNFSKLGYEISSYDDFIFITKGFTINTELPIGFFKATQRQISNNIKPDGTSDESRKVKTTDSYVRKSYTIGKSTSNSGRKVTLSGLVTNSADGSPIIGGTIFVKETSSGVATNTVGYYEIQLAPGSYNLVFNSLESIERSVSIKLLGAGELNISLDQNLFELQEVEISSSKTHNVKGTQLGFNKISSKTIREIPVVMGEQDVLKVAMLLPGVTSVGEGTSGFNVRGSPTDQNLFYLSNMPVFNTSHVFGFFSAFNADAVESFNLYKGSIPVNFGGRLSSVFDIKTKQGNMKDFKARGGISPITARILAEGPIIKDKLSYIVGLRSTYSDWVLKLVKDPEVNRSKAYFGDVLIGVDAIINDKNSIKVTGYGSYDDIKLADNSLYTYNNMGGGINWYHSFNSRTEMKLSLVHSEYGFSESFTENPQTGYTRNYKLMSDEIDANFNIYPIEGHTIIAGISSKLYNLNRGNYKPYNNESSISEISFGKEKGLESAIYIGDEWQIGSLLTISGGIRYNFYQYLGPNSVFEYANGAPKEPQYITDTLTYSNNQVIKSYNAPDFRLSAVYLLSPNLSVKASYNRLHQYIFLLTNTIAVSPSDTWKLADYNIKPMTGDQFTVGIYANIGKSYEISVEGYYKDVKNLVEYKNGADLITSKYIEQDALQGNLDSYGIEFMLKKPFGKLTGWLNYSYSRSMVLVNNNITGENINFGEKYPSNYDRPNTFNLVANYYMSKRISLSGNVSYATGRPITYPTAIYYLDGNKILNYSLRNEYRIPDYFRIDLAMKIEGNLLSKKLGHSSFILSVYNLTGRKNAYSVYFKSENGQINGYKMSIFGTQIYSVTWDFKLGNYND